MTISDDYEKWCNEMLTETDKEVARLVDGEHINIKKTTCQSCTRAKTKNICECEDYSIECYYCHLVECHLCGV
jgi:hypothetical protein